MKRFASLSIKFRWVFIVAWMVLAICGISVASKTTSSLSYDFGLPGQPGYEANQKLVKQLGIDGGNAPLLLAVHTQSGQLPDSRPLRQAIEQVLPGTKLVTYSENSKLSTENGQTGYIVAYPIPLPGAEPYAKALPALQNIAKETILGPNISTTVSGQDVVANNSGNNGSNVLIETIFGGTAALIILVLIFGSFLALTPLIVAAVSILTTFLCVYGLTRFTEVSFIVQYLLALIGLGVAIDYSLLIITRWREERAKTDDNRQAVATAIATAGRSVLFSGITVAISLAALILLPIPFLRSVGLTGLLIPLISVASSLTLLPAILLIIGSKLDWPHRRSRSSVSTLWERVGKAVVARRWASAILATVMLLVLALPVLNIQLGQASNASIASSAAKDASTTALTDLNSNGIGAGLSAPILVTTINASSVMTKLASHTDISYQLLHKGTSQTTFLVWTKTDSNTLDGSKVISNIRRDLKGVPNTSVGGQTVQNQDFITAVYKQNLWIIGLVVVATFILLAFALKSIVLPIKALLLNVLSLAAAYGITTFIWQSGHGTELLFNQAASGAVTVWVPIAAFAFLFGLSMDYEVFLLSRIREEYQATGDTDRATVAGVAKTGRLVTSAALILFCAFISLSRIPSVDVKILATTLALGIVIDATIVRGILAPALVAGLGKANWWLPRFTNKNKS